MKIKEDKNMIYQISFTIPSYKDDETYEVEEYCASIKSLKEYFFKDLLYREAEIGDLPPYIIPSHYQHVGSLKSEHRFYAEKRVLKVRIEMHFIYR